MIYVYKIKCVYESEVEIEADNNEDAECKLFEHTSEICYDGTIDGDDWETDLLGVYND